MENPDKLLCVNHKDGDKLNNNVGNLEWCSYSDNAKHSVEVLGKGCRENHYKQAVTEVEIILICELLSKGFSVKATFYELLSEGIVVYPYTISDVKRRQTWKTVSCNYKW